MRPSGRAVDQMRAVSLETGVARHAEGSCLVSFGDTHVLCTASVEERVPPFLRNTGKGWVTAEYGMLPRATHTRSRREAARGKQSGRTQEIQRLIGRSLRAVVDLTALGERQIILDCDVLQADGGTRTASITGAWVALHHAPAELADGGRASPRSPIARPGGRDLAAASVDGAPCSTSTMTRTACRGRRQLRADRRRRHRRGPGHGGRDPDRRHAVRGDARLGAQGRGRAWWPLQRQALGC